MIEKPRIEGYWYSKYSAEYPAPIPNDQPWDGQAEFLMKLTEKENTAGLDRYRGFSLCRVCDCVNGSTEFKTSKWVWPKGFRHYVEVHNVKPSDDFIDFVTGTSPS